MITIIVPLFGSAATVHSTLSSVRATKAVDFECIIVNDGSTDHGPKIVEAFCALDTRFRMVCQPNRGLSAARNTGIEESTGEYLYFLDADDVVYPDGLRLLSDALEHHGGCGVAYGGYANIDANGKELDIVPHRPRIEAADLFFFNPFPVHACLVRRSLVMEVGMFDTSLRSLEDWDLWLRLARCGVQFDPVSAVVAAYRRTAGSMSMGCERMFLAYRMLSGRFNADSRLAGKDALTLPEEKIREATMQMDAFYLGWSLTADSLTVAKTLEDDGAAGQILAELPNVAALQASFCFGLGYGLGNRNVSLPRDLSYALEKVVPVLMRLESRIANDMPVSSWFLQRIGEAVVMARNELSQIAVSKWYRIGQALGFVMPIAGGCSSVKKRL
jgi:GT2 family glycosyltransferase